MNKRDVSELKRRLNPEKRNPTLIRGCYVAADGRVISSFSRDVVSLPEGENEKYMALFKRALSGTMGQNLLPVAFTPNQQLDGEQYKLLTALRASQLKDEDLLNAFMARAIEAVTAMHATADSGKEAAGSLILLLHDNWDVPSFDANGEDKGDDSSEMFSYLLCAICPVKKTAPMLSYSYDENDFHSRDADWVVGAPDMGFLFPAWEEHAANMSEALFYTKDVADTREPFAQAVLGCTLASPAEQKEAFQAILTETLGEELSYGVAQAMHETVSELVEAGNADRSAPPVKLDRAGITEILRESGISEERTEAFARRYDETMGRFAELDARSVASPGKFEVSTPSVSVKVAPEAAGLVETRIIDGKRCIVIFADGDVLVNGVPVA